MPSFGAVLFDCDGVLVDSEPLTNGVLRDMLHELGWTMTREQCMNFFVGKAVRDERAAIEHHTGQPITEAWMAEFYVRRNAALEQNLVAIDGALSAVGDVHAHLLGRIACASGADRFKVDMQLTKVGLMPYFEGRIFSGHEMPRSKPAPDVYLAAAAALGIGASRCLVVEDSVTGVTAGVTAGATVVGFSPSSFGHGSPQALRAAGATHVITQMSELLSLVLA